ncbi:MAG: transposase [Deltaproteobacteria bacterium]|nr:transposase [Deltaproteobacteria bacterium]
MIGRSCPAGKTCSRCGHVTDAPASRNGHACERCGHVTDRDRTPP